MSHLGSDSDDAISILCAGDIECDEPIQNVKVLKHGEECISSLQGTDSSETKSNLNSNECEQTAKPAFQGDKNNAFYHMSNHIERDPSTSVEVVQNAINKTLICHESYLDNTADAIILGHKNGIEGDVSTCNCDENNLVSECDIVHDAPSCEETIVYTALDASTCEEFLLCESDGNCTLICESDSDIEHVHDASRCEETTVDTTLDASTCEETNVDTALDASTCEEFLLCESDGNCSLTLCESDSYIEQVPISENTNICNVGATIDEFLVPILENSDIEGNACSVAMSYISSIDEDNKQETRVCTYDGNSSIYNGCLAIISENLDIIPQPDPSSVKVNNTSSIDENDKQDIADHSASNITCAASKTEVSKVLETALLKHTEIECNRKNESPDNQGKGSVTVENKPEPSRDFYEKEKDDVIDPRWQKVKELSTNEERYQQVKNCWDSTTVPDPDRNLTYHSYRKKQFQTSKTQIQIRQHKRQASTKLVGNETKRLRPCTYLFDDKITAIAKEQKERTNEIRKEMNSKIKKIEIKHLQKKTSLQNLLPAYNRINHYNYNTNSFLDMQFENLQHEHERQVASVEQEYQRTFHQCDADYHSGINYLSNIRNEVLQFYNFYKGANKRNIKDPTLLNDTQLQELDDIESFYSQMDNYYN